MTFHHLAISILWVRAAAVAFSTGVLTLPFPFPSQVRVGVFFGEEGPALAEAGCSPTTFAFSIAANTTAESPHWFPGKASPDSFCVPALVKDVLGSVGLTHTAHVRYHNMLGAIIR